MIGLAGSLSAGIGVALTVALTGALIVVAVIDLRTFRIPDLISLPLIAAGLGIAFAVPGGYGPDHLIGAAGAYLAFAAIGAAHFRARGIDGLGLGDAKLFAAAGAWLGWQALPIVLLIAALGGLGQALARRDRGAPLAFGPWLAAGFWVVWTLTLLRAI